MLDIELETIPRLPPKESSFGKTQIKWAEVAPGYAVIDTKDGSPLTRHLATLLLSSDLEGCGYIIDWDRMPDFKRRQSTWNQVMQKGVRLYRDGHVTMLRNSQQQVMGQVEGDHGVYTPWFTRQDAGSAVWTQSGCSCPWEQYRWQRTKQWRKYEGRACLVASTMITMADGTYKPISEIQSGDKVWTHDGIGEVTDTSVRSYEGDIMKIESFGHGKTLEITPNHPLWAYGTPQRLKKSWQDIKDQGFKYYDESFLYENDPDWIDAGEIQEYDWLTSPILDDTSGAPLDFSSLIPSNWNYIERDGMITRRHGLREYQGSLPRYIEPTPALMNLLGLFMSEGIVSVPIHGYNTQIEWSLHKDERETLGKIIENSLRSLGIKETVSFYEKENRLSVRVKHHPLALLLHILAGQYSSQKQWHSWVMTLGPQWQKIILWHHWKGDGNHSGGNDTRMTIHTASLQLALQTKEMLLRCGKLPTWQMAKQNGGPTNREKECTIYRVMWVDDRQYTNGQRSDPDRMYVMNKIRSIEREQFKGDVYNFSVYPQQSYIADGRIVHNCAHLIALAYQSAVTPLDDNTAPQPQFSQQPQMSMPGAQEAAPPGTAGYDINQAPASDFRVLQQDNPWGTPNVQPLQQPSNQPPFVSTEPLLIPMQAEDYQKALMQAPQSIVQQQGPNPGTYIDNRGTLSSIVMAQGEQTFQQGDTVRINVATMAQKEGKEGAIDNGEWVDIPRNTQGEVFDVDTSTGWVSVIFPMPGPPMTVPYPIMANMARSYMEPQSLTLINRGGLSTPFMYGS